MNVHVSSILVDFRTLKVFNFGYCLRQSFFPLFRFYLVLKQAATNRKGWRNGIFDHFSPQYNLNVESQRSLLLNVFIFRKLQYYF